MSRGKSGQSCNAARPTSRAYRLSLSLIAMASFPGRASLNNRDGFDRFRRSRQQCLQSPGILRRRALLVVVEVYKHLAALSLPGLDLLRPFAKRVRGVVALVAATGAVPADINKIRRSLPGSRRVMMIGDA